jgi:hypothetical protein
MNSGTGKARIIKANRMLQAKVGAGPLDPEAVKKSQDVLDENKVDFGPMAEGFLKELSESVENARKNLDTGDHGVLIGSISAPVMQLKANAGMFGYSLLGSLANIMLSFLETIDKIDKDVIEIVNAHHQTLSLIIKAHMSGDGGDQGEQLQMELRDACKRYFAKQGDMPTGGSAAFFKD